MENTPLISMSFVNYAPDVEIEVRNRYQQWVNEAYIPIGMKNPGRPGVDLYQILNESPEYPQIGTIAHYENLKAREVSLNSPNFATIKADRETWNKRRVREGIWSVWYELARGFRSESGLQGNKADTIIENAPVVHLEGYRLTPEEQETYATWLGNFGYDFISLFIKLPGFKGYDFFKDVGLKPMNEAREREYPSNLSIMYFENLQSFEDYTKSKELLIFQKALRNVFPRGLNIKWYVQYQLVKSWRK